LLELYLIFRRAFVHPLPSRHPVDDRDALNQVHGPLYKESGGDLTSTVQLHWSLVVFEFTARALTFETDRLAALAGIASLLCRRTAQQYYFGVLSGHAVRCLLWRNSPKSRRSRPSKRLAAGFARSWSFGSITGRVSFEPNPERFTLFHQTAHVHHISRELASNANPSGSGTGTMDIEGCIIPVHVEDRRHLAARKEELVLFLADDGSTESRVENPPYDYPPHLPQGYFQSDVDGHEEEVYRTTRMCLLILGWCGVVDKKGEQPFGLMLSEGTGSNGSPVYRRVGIFTGGGGFGGYSVSRWAEFGSTKLICLV